MSDKAPDPSELTIGLFVPVRRGDAGDGLAWRPGGPLRLPEQSPARVLGPELADIPRFTWSSTLLEEDQEQLYRVFSVAMAGRKAFTVTARYRRADGAVRTLQTRAEPRFAPNGEFLGMVGVNSDVTDA